MSILQRWHTTAAALAASVMLVACGGGGADSAPSAPPPSASPAPQEAGAPVLTNNISTDGFNWINYRRVQGGMPILTRNAQVDNAALGHSEYQRVNNIVSHEQVPGKQGFTGAALSNRLQQAGYLFNPAANFAYGEVISATSSKSGVYMAEELITAIYHRFVIFEPRFKEIGTGSATASSGYSYFTANFAASGGYGPGVGKGQLATWPASGQSGIARNFLSDYELPDPVAGINEVGYPVSVHADIDARLDVSSFTLHPRGEANVEVKLLRRATDEHTPQSAAAIVPMAVLRAATTYDASFAGTVDGLAVSKTWSFTTK
ncbi:MAG: CAP domain-containing protein [Bdellovibrionales bacterium]|nr:CAP domain-containing protein [Massilia sp.]